MALALPNTAVVPGRFERPEQVPPTVADGLIAAVLREGRPEGLESSITVDGLRCPTLTRGRGTPVLCVHGLGHDSSDWRPLWDAGLKGVEWRALDLPGFGLADKPRRAYPLTLLRDAVLAAAAACSRPPIVVASSLGGHVALLATLFDPEAFAGLLLVGPGGLEAAPAPVAATARAYYSFAAICARTDEQIVENSRRIFATEHPAREALAARKLALHRSSLRASFAWPFASVVDDVLRHPVAERVADVRAPLHFVAGAKDAIVPLSLVADAAEKHGVPLSVLEDAGHLPMVEAAASFARILEGFLAQRSCPGPSRRAPSGGL